MATDPPKWQQITPQELIPAVEHIRDSYDASAEKCFSVTEHLCYLALHPDRSVTAEAAQYKATFPAYRRIVGIPAQQQFDQLLRIGTPSSIFKAFLSICSSGLKTVIASEFNEVLAIGLANRSILATLPADWAKSARLQAGARGSTHQHRTELVILG